MERRVCVSVVAWERRGGPNVVALEPRPWRIRKVCLWDVRGGIVGGGGYVDGLEVGVDCEFAILLIDGVSFALGDRGYGLHHWQLGVSTCESSIDVLSHRSLRINNVAA